MTFCLDREQSVCVWRLTLEKAKMEAALHPGLMNHVVVPETGLCEISDSQKKPCLYPFCTAEECSLDGARGDFCQKSWAVHFH